MRLALLTTLAMLPFTVQAATPDDGCLQHTVPLSSASAAGTVQFCIRYAPEVPSQEDTFRLSATLTTPTLSGPNPSLSITVTSLAGCTLGPVDTHQTSPGNPQGATLAKSWLVAQDARHCTLNVRATVTSGGNTISAMDQAVNVRTQTDWWDTFGLFVYALWIVCFVLTRFIRGLFAGTFRLLVDVVSAIGVLALPIPAQQFELIAGASYLVIMVDLVVVLFRPGDA